MFISFREIMNEKLYANINQVVLRNIAKVIAKVGNNQTSTPLLLYSKRANKCTNNRHVDYIPKNSTTILDVGCGTGLLGEEIKKLFPKTDLWG